MINKKTVKCSNIKCGYIWETKSTKKFVSCPDCLTKVLNISYNKNQKEGQE